jgi:predicted dinucleotide-binding enzyme
MRVVVIGKGTIGSAISKALEEKGHEVVPERSSLNTIELSPNASTRLPSPAMNAGRNRTILNFSRRPSSKPTGKVRGV